MASSNGSPPVGLSNFVRLPIEIRLEVYSLLLCAEPSHVFQIRTASTSTYHKLTSTPIKRTTYCYIADRMRSRSAESTYHLLSDWRQPQATIHTAVLLTNRQINEEATHELYASHTFDFALDIECIVPFLSDLTPRARGCLRSISLTKRAPPYTKDFDRSEWKAACTCIATNLSYTLATLQLNVYGGCPALGFFAGQHRMPVEGGAADELSPFTTEVFVHLAGWEELEWARQLAAVKGLRTVVVQAIMEHCPPPESSAMAFYVGFSRSIEAGFKDWLSEIMVQMGDSA